jgi:hypothetical protein
MSEYTIEDRWKTTAVGFLQALKKSQELRDQWVVLARNKDWLGLRELIAGTQFLDQTPSAEDLKAMHSYADSHLSAQCKEIEELDRRVDPDCIFNGRDGYGEGC